MNLADLAAIASIISSAAVAASLLYLGLQVHQNTPGHSSIKGGHSWRSVRRWAIVSGTLLPLVTTSPVNATHCVLPSDLPKKTISGASSGYASFGAYVPRHIFSLEQVPLSIRAKLDVYLDSWLGPSMRNKLKFVGGQLATEEDFLRAYPKAATKSIGWRNFTYNLLFDISIPAAGVESFVAGVQFDGEGKMMSDLQFPPTGQDPRLEKLIALNDAYALARSHGFDPARTVAALKYNDIDRRLVIELLQPIECSGRIAKYKGISIDAHDGRLIGEFEQGGPHHMPSPF